MSKDKPKKLTTKETEETKKSSIIDASAYNVMYGFGEQYVTPFALRLGATSPEIGILSSVPAFIGSVSQFFGAKLTNKYKDRKRIVLWFAMMQGLFFIPLFIIPFFTKSILLLTVIFAAYLLCGNMAAPAWNSWIGDVIPEQDRARYFSKRNRISIIFLLLSVLAAGLILTYFTDVNIWLGFGILFGIAVVGRIISWYYLIRQHEPRYDHDPKNDLGFGQFLKMIPKTNFGNFVVFRSLMGFAVLIASPFFAVYMLQDLGLSYIEYTIVVLAPMLAKIITMTYWGRYSERFGSRNIMYVSSIVIASVPLWWFLAGYFFGPGHAIFYMIIAIEILSGFAWAGFELTTFNYILETAEPKQRANSVAYFNMVYGVATLAGGIATALLIKLIPSFRIPLAVLLVVFLISALLRFAVAIIMLPKLKEVRVKERIDERKLLFDLVIAKPVNNTLQNTATALIVAEKNIVNIHNRTTNTLKKITGPVHPIVRGVIESLDEGLEKAEKVRKRIEPDIVKKHKREIYDQLVNKDFRRFKIKQKRRR